MKSVITVVIIINITAISGLFYLKEQDPAQRWPFNKPMQINELIAKENQKNVDRSLYTGNSSNFNPESHEGYLDNDSECVLGMIDTGRHVCVHCRQYYNMFKQSACFYETFQKSCPVSWKLYCLWFSFDPNDAIANTRKKIFYVAKNNLRRNVLI